MSRYSGRNCQYKMSYWAKMLSLFKKKESYVCVYVHVLTYSKMYVNDRKSCRKCSSKKIDAIFQKTTWKTYSLLGDLLLRNGFHEPMLSLFPSSLFTSLKVSTIKKKNVRRRTLLSVQNFLPFIYPLSRRSISIYNKLSFSSQSLFCILSGA